MDEKPIHFDGSSLTTQKNEGEAKPLFQLNDEARKLIGQNPYSFELDE